MTTQDESIPIETKVLKGDSMIQTIFSFIEKAAKRPSSSSQPSSFVYSINDRYTPRLAQVLLEFVGELTKGHPAFNARYVTDIQKDNLAYVSRIIDAGVEVRHVQGNKVSFSVSQYEYLNSYQKYSSGGQNVPESMGEGEIVWSNFPDLVSQMKDVFERLWETAVPASFRIRQLEEGIDPGETRVVSGMGESIKLLTSLLAEVGSEIQAIAAPKWFTHRNQAMFAALVRKAREERGIKVRVLTPSFGDDHKPSEAISGVGLEQRYCGWPINAAIVILDRNKMLLSQYSEDVNPKGVDDELFSSLYTTNQQTVEGMASVFEALWQENELREDERRSRKEAELLRDLLSHDIRNRNQVALIMAEVLREQLGTTPEILAQFEKLIRAIDSSNQLVEKANELGRVLAEKNPPLHPVNLFRSIEEAFELASKANPSSVIRHKLSVPSESGSGNYSPSLVLADDLLSEVFLNLYLNAVKYTRGSEVEIETIVADEIKPIDETVSQGPPEIWKKVTVADHGSGMLDEFKNKAFRRYLKGAEGSGLGLSIVHALVVGRYSGKVAIKDRVEGDYSRGTKVEVWLPKAI